MTKKEAIELARQTGWTKADAERAFSNFTGDISKKDFESFISSISKYKNLVKGENFLTFSLRYLDKECIAIAMAKNLHLNYEQNLNKNPLARYS